MQRPTARPALLSKRPADQTCLVPAGLVDPDGRPRREDPCAAEIPSKRDTIGASALDTNPIKNAMPTHPLQQGSIPRW
jgi:hypothetical protein